MELQFDPPTPGTTIDLGEEGLTSNDAIDPYLDRYWDSDRMVVIPAGQYRLEDPELLTITANEDAWLVGDGHVVLAHGRVRDTQFNFTAEADAHLRVQNLSLTGLTLGTDTKMRAWAPHDGIVEFVNLNRPDGTEDLADSTGCYVPPSHAGILRFIDCQFEGFSNNGVYASSPGFDRGNDGAVEFYGGLYRNCDVSAIRVGSSNAKVVGAVVINDETATTIEDKPSGVQRGIRIRSGGDGILIRECEIFHGDAPGVSRPIAIENGLPEFPADHGSVQIEATRIRNDTPHAAISMREPDAGYESTGELLELTGSGSTDLDGGPYRSVIRGSKATPPRTEKRWVYDGPFAFQGSG